MKLATQNLHARQKHIEIHIHFCKYQSRIKKKERQIKSKALTGGMAAETGKFLPETTFLHFTNHPNCETYHSVSRQTVNLYVFAPPPFAVSSGSFEPSL